MTDLLRTLMRDEAAHLDVPPPPATEILAGGHRRVRRRRVGVGATALAVTAVAGLAVGAAVTGDGSDRPADVADPGPTYGVVLADGSRVAVGEGLATVPGTVHDLVFTSEGALVRSNQNDGASDGSGPEALTLVRPDGSTVDLGTIPEGVGPATDPSESVYALAEQDGDGFVAVLRDVRTGEEVDRVPLPDRPPSYWDVPPLALDDDHVYVGYRKETWAVDRETGEVQQVVGGPGGIPDVAGGRMATTRDASVAVTDPVTGEELMVQPIDGFGFSELSPDGTHLAVTTENEETFGESTTLYAVDTGESLDLPALGAGWGWSWTPQGDALAVGKKGITVCDVVDGCSEQPLPAGFAGDVKPGGQRFES
ncbi:PQQ-like beta-propeller repeat protein [Nocardioides dongkuii]|uniref:PQQ-like beta-propeller repeat protein n=1 Tax=Nocardioides dongkuii TaxID=2760089 RepID=UPI00187892CF|nr:PQQ-like beta-propeller repeat protein [Nocardioides dongkuii]